MPPPEVPAEFEEDYGATLRGMGERVEVRISEKYIQAVLERAMAGGAEVTAGAEKSEPDATGGPMSREEAAAIEAQEREQA